MKVKIHEVLTRKNRYKRLVFILVLFSLVLLVGILGFGLTKEKEKKVQKTEQFVSSQKVVLVIVLRKGLSSANSSASTWKCSSHAVICF